MPLILATMGKKYPVKKIGGLKETQLHLKNLGFIPGTQICVVSAICGNLIVQVKDARIAISRELAEKILI